MNQDQVEKLLKEDPTLAKEISLNDGQRHRVLSRERWLAGPFLTILDPNGEMVHISYRNIASIRIVKRNGRGNRRRR